MKSVFYAKITIFDFIKAAEKRHVESLLSGLPGQSENSRSEKCELDDENKKGLYH